MKQHTQHHQRVSSFLPVGDNCAKFARRGALTRDPIACFVAAGCWLAAGGWLLACLAALLFGSIYSVYSAVLYFDKRKKEKGRRREKD